MSMSISVSRHLSIYLCTVLSRRGKSRAPFIMDSDPRPYELDTSATRRRGGCEVLILDIGAVKSAIRSQCVLENRAQPR